MKRKRIIQKPTLLQQIISQFNISHLPKKIIIQAGKFHMTIDWNQPQ